MLVIGRFDLTCASWLINFTIVVIFNRFFACSGFYNHGLKMLQMMNFRIFQTHNNIYKIAQQSNLSNLLWKSGWMEITFKWFIFKRMSPFLVTEEYAVLIKFSVSLGCWYCRRFDKKFCDPNHHSPESLPSVLEYGYLCHSPDTWRFALENWYLCYPSY